MNILQRRSKRSSTSALSARMSSYQDKLSARAQAFWQALSPRDQLALGILCVFLLLFIGGYGGYSVHQAAKASKADYQEQVADYFWLRGQASNIDSSALTNTQGDGVAQPPANRVSLLLNDSGIDNAQVVAAGKAVQLTFSDPSQATASAALGLLEQQGWQFTQLSMEQDLATKEIQVQATVNAL